MPFDEILEEKIVDYITNTFGDAKKYIDYAIEQRSKNDLADFVREKDLRNDVLFLAIFDKINI